MLSRLFGSKLRLSTGLRQRMLAVLFPAIATVSFAQIGRGADGLFIGDQVMTFARAECTRSFLPGAAGSEESVDTAWSLVSRQLDIFTDKLPATGAYLRSFFENGRVLWCFVDSELREVKPTATSNSEDVSSSILLAYEKQQAAVNQNNVVRIRRDLWNAMDTESRAAVLLLEGLWSAIGSQYITSGQQLRDVTNLLLNPNLGSFTSGNLARFLEQFLGLPCANTLIVSLARFDINQRTMPSSFAFDLDFTGPSPKLKLTVRDPSSALNGYQVTQLNPNNRYPNVLAHRNGRVFTDLSERSRSNLHPITKIDLCSEVQRSAVQRSEVQRSAVQRSAVQRSAVNWHEMDTNALDLGAFPANGFGDQQPWRLPTTSELYDLYELGLLQVRFMSGVRSERILSCDGTFADHNRKTSFVYPTDRPLVLLTAEGRQYDVANQFQEVTHHYLFNRRGQISGCSKLHYTQYFCVRGVTN